MALTRTVLKESELPGLSCEVPWQRQEGAVAFRLPVSPTSSPLRESVGDAAGVDVAIPCGVDAPVDAIKAHQGVLFLEATWLQPQVTRIGRESMSFLVFMGA